MLKWKAIGDVLGSAVAAAGASFLASKQAGATDEQAGSAAAVAAVTAIIQQFRSAPTVRE